MSSPVRNTQSPPQHNNPWQHEAQHTIRPAAFANNANTGDRSRQQESRSRGRHTPRQEEDRRPTDDDDGDVPMYTANEVNRFLAEASVPSLYHGKTPGQIVSNVVSRMSNSDKLQPSGSNFAIWELMMRERALEIFGVPTWYTKVCTDPIQEQIGRSLLLATVDSNMHRSILRQSNCYLMFQYLNSRFFTVTRAEQMTCWDRLINFKMVDYSNSAKAVSKLFEILDDFNSFGIDLNRETIGGMALQASLEAGSEWRREVDRRVEQDLGGSSRTLSKKAVTPDQILKHIDIVKRQTDLGSSKSTFSAMVPQAHQASTVGESDLTKEFYDPSSWPASPAVQGLATYGLQCWNCRSPDHLLSKCKLPRRRDFDRPPIAPGQPRRQWQTGPPSRTNNPPIVAPGNFQAWYPIMTPPGYINQGYKPSGSQYAPPMGNPAGPHQSRRPDLYRPNNRPRPPLPSNQRPPAPSTANSTEVTEEQEQATQSHEPSDYTNYPTQPFQEPTSRMIEIGVLDEGLDQGLIPSFSQLTVGEGDEPVVDTGATHHLTGNRGWGPLFSDPEWANRNS
ncbi:hypothetical protein PGT21_050234 [Puccinia graminis f. sp. tritici]|uniref:CCHC-type domain-containing protein n=1 Tax=Puccinia graminis f. sp. tritici TaxID=56615 RepID=A0A5B0NP44_PUCGR|nr:hypothetical protein PGTUg99_050019 [Puccinia graminis f. sp. tritici]KAA1090603.1 hypothetical protein PGT21_050234 [Puccinia graminis f. sp. tritici]